MILINHASFAYHKKTPIFLKDINLRIDQGEKVGVLGESGAGKSTLGSIILGQHIPTKGNIIIQSKKVLPIFQHAIESFDCQYTIQHSLEEPLNFYRHLKSNDIQETILKYLNKFNLSSHLLKKYPSEVSGGQIQRFNIIRSLMAQPDILVCDEITSNLDVFAEQNVINILKEEEEVKSKTIIVISHDLSVLQRLTQRMIVLKNGKIVDDFVNKDLFSNQRHPYTKLLIQTFE